MHNGKPARVAVLKTDGVNCDAETLYAFNQFGPQAAQAELVHVNQLRAGSANLADYDILALAGGFSYGDDIASGRVLANELTSHLREQLQTFVDRPDTLVIGICNGFQVLVRTGLLPFRELGRMSVTLAHNASGRFECRPVKMVVEQGSPCVFTRHFNREIELPVAHGEGRFDALPGVIQEIEERHLVVLRYSRAGAPTMEFPHNPNGSTSAIAGICDPTGRILGLMPHPERLLEERQHPNWRRQEGVIPYGKVFFANAIRYVNKSR